MVCRADPTCPGQRGTHSQPADPRSACPDPVTSHCRSVTEAMQSVLAVEPRSNETGATVAGAHEIVAFRSSRSRAPALGHPEVDVGICRCGSMRVHRSREACI